MRRTGKTARKRAREAAMQVAGMQPADMVEVTLEEMAALPDGSVAEAFMDREGWMFVRYDAQAAH